jgi:uncharacterized protein (DUF2249 family)
MSDVLIASNQADAEAADKVVEHHAAMGGRLGVLVGKLEAAQTGAEALAARDELVDWARTELVPHAKAEESVLYAAAVNIPGYKVLVEAMIAEHRVLISLIDALAAASHPVRAIASAGGLRTLFETHVDKENTLVVPALVGSSEHSMADLLDQMHAALPTPEAGSDATQPTGGHTCGCGGHDDEGMPVLDAREIPHAIRHATIFGALEAVQPGNGLILQADHDPVPLLMPLEQRAPGAFEISYLQRGPELFEIQLVRR